MKEFQHLVPHGSMVVAGDGRAVVDLGPMGVVAYPRASYQPPGCVRSFVRPTLADDASVSTASRFLAWSLSVWHFSGFVTPVTLGIPWTVLSSSSECHHAAEPTTLRAEPSVPEALLGWVHAVTQCIRSLFEPSHAT